MVSLDQLRWAIHTAEPGERVRVQFGVMSKWSATDGVLRYPHYHLGVWLDADMQSAKPMKVLNA
jgi:hypothetical protein